MKNFRVLGIMFLFVAAAFTSCTDDDKGERSIDSSAIFFNQSTQRVILNGSDDDVLSTIDFSATLNATAPYQVTLVFDAANSTAVEGVDFEIISNVATVPAGAIGGSFQVKYLQTPAVTAGKVAKFTLQSSSVDVAVFKNVTAVTMVLSCQLDLATFPLNYEVQVYAFDQEADPHNQTLTPVAGQENTFSVPSMWGPNFVAWATGNASYAGQFVYPARLIINCDNTVDVITTGTQFLGGSGTYDPATGVIDVIIQQGLFTAPFDTNCVFYPL